MDKLIVILGPTASGKTALSIKLAKKFDGEIVSADSRQIYRGMDIGTAKPPISRAPRSGTPAKSSAPSHDGAQTPAIAQGIKHYLIDIKKPNESYTLAQYKKDAIKAIKKILKSGKVPFLVGGTGLYIKAIVENLNIPEVGPNKQLRRKLERQLTKHGLPYLYGKLNALDPETAYIIDPKNPRRIIRALEIAMITKKPFSQERKKGQPLFEPLLLGTSLSGEKLKKRITQRTEAMIRSRLLSEVEELIQKYGPRRVPFDAIGYREIIDYFKGKINLDQAQEQIKKNTWRFAKRQMTWFRRLPVVWIKNQIEAEREIKKFLAH